MEKIAHLMSKEVRFMTWETPKFTEIKMDAEINAYQEDFGDVEERH